MTRMRLISAILSTVLAASALVARAQENPRTMLQAGRKQENEAVGKSGDLRAAQLAKALKVYSLIPGKWPDALREKATAHLRMGAIHNRLMDREQALASLANVLEVPGQSRLHAEALETKASILRKAKDFDGARGALTQIVSDYPIEARFAARACLTLGSISKQQKRWKEAWTWGERVLSDFGGLWRENVDACNLLCSVLIRCRRWPDAINKLDELDKLLEKKFSEHAKWESISKAMQRMSSRRTLTPQPVEDQG